MSNSDIDKALNFIQNPSSAAAPAPAANGPIAKPSSTDDTNCLPGLEPPPAPQKAPEAAKDADTVIRSAPPRPTNPLAQALARQEKKGNYKPHSPTSSAKASVSGLKLGLAKYVGWAIAAACVGVAIVAAAKFISPRVVVREVVRELPDGIPLALLPESADPSLWAIVSKMSGAINGANLEFKHGIAYANGVEYKVGLDFCRSKDDIYVRVKGTSSWVVKLNGQGEIVKVYPSPKSNKPLKEIFGR